MSFLKSNYKIVKTFQTTFLTKTGIYTMWIMYQKLIKKVPIRKWADAVCNVLYLLACFTLYNRVQFHPSHQNWFKWILFNGCIILHGVHVPQLPYPFVCWWASRLLPCPGYYKQCCNEHWGARVSFRSGFLGVHAQKWDCWVIWQFYFQFFKKSPHCFP